MLQRAYTRFKKAEQTHGLRYIRFIGDGDSSVYPTLLLLVPIWGREIIKLECANHACKCYRASLEKLVANNPVYKGKGGLTEKMRKKLTTSARCAIKMRSIEPDRESALKQLKVDLINGPYYCALGSTVSVVRTSVRLHGTHSRSSYTH